MIKDLIKRDELITKLNILMQIGETLKKEEILLKNLQEDLENEDLTKKEIIFKISPNIYASNKGYFIVRLTNEIFLEKNKEELIAYLEKKAEKINERIKKLQEEIKLTENQIKDLDLKLQGLQLM